VPIVGLHWRKPHIVKSHKIIRSSSLPNRLPNDVTELKSRLSDVLDTIEANSHLAELVASVGSAFISGDSLTIESDMEPGARLPAGQVSAFGLIRDRIDDERPEARRAGWGPP